MKHITHHDIKRHNYWSSLILALLLMLTSGCKKFVAVETPQSLLLGELVFEEQSTAVAALSAVYGQLRSDNNGLLYGSIMGMPIYMAQYADEIVNYSNRGQNYGENFFKSVIFVDSEDIYSLWNAAFNQIYNTNAIIEGLERSVKLTPSQTAQVRGEALFIRALLHFYLANLFGDIPYVSTTDYLGNKDLSRQPLQTVYAQILSDLQLAEELVSEEYPSAERVRANKFVVRAFMARVYLYQNKWVEAEEMATAVIDHNSVYQWVDDISTVFLRQSTGTIWALMPSFDGTNTEEGFMYTMVSNPLPNGRSMSPQLVNAFEPGDKRRDAWVGTFTQGANTWYFPYKYKERGNTGTSKEFSIILRLEEQYLIRAEARAQQENIEGAQEDLNKIRNRAELDNTGASDKASLLDAVLHERQVELFTEYGHRWFDLKRMGKSNEVLGAIKPNWNPEDILLPIPEKELLVNPKLNPQNPGYLQ